MASSAFYSTGYFYYQFYQGNHSCVQNPIINSYGYLLNQCYNGYSAYGEVKGSVVYQCAGMSRVRLLKHLRVLFYFTYFRLPAATGSSATVSVYNTANCAGIPQSSFLQQLGNCYLEETKAFQPLCSSSPILPLQVPSVLYGFV